MQRYSSQAKEEGVPWNLMRYFKMSNKRNVKNNQDNFENLENSYPIKCQDMS